MTPFERRRLVALLLSALLLLLPGCTTMASWLAPGDDELTFPRTPASADQEGSTYDVDGDGTVDFAVRRGPPGALGVLEYDDDQDGRFDRSYRLDDYADRELPHLVLLVDSLPYRVVAERWRGGSWPWFREPVKVIPPFPSMSEVTFSSLLGAPPLGGNIERYYDRRTGEIENLWVARAFGYLHPWQRRLDVLLDSYLDVGMSYLQPRPWYRAELAAVKRAVDEAAQPVVLAYVVSSSAMLSRYGQAGLDECLTSLDQLVLQLLYERQGAIRISIISDHGHTLVPARNFLMEDLLVQAGFSPTDEIVDRHRDVVMEIDGLVTYFGVHTSRPALVADALLPSPEVQLAVYLDGDAVVVRTGIGSVARITRRSGRFRYQETQGDPLGYATVLAKLAARGAVDGDGYVGDRDWFESTVDEEFPDGPRRLWDAFHGQVINPPQVLFTLTLGACAGLESMESWIEMQSTHGGLDQLSSDAVLMTTVGGLDGPFRTGEVLRRLEPRLRSRLGW